MAITIYDTSSLLVIVALSVACDERPVDTSPPRTEVLAPLRVSARGGFDLTLLESGAALVRIADSGDLVATPLDAIGTRRGEDLMLHRRAPGEELSDVVATSTTDGVAAAWVQHGAREARVLALRFDPISRRAEPPSDLGATTRVSGGAQPGLAVAADGAAAMVLVRGLDEPCAGGEGRCAAYAFFQLSPSGLRPRGLPLSVPRPCAIHPVSLSVGENAWHYSICAERAGTWTTTWFTVQQPPAYARAEQVLSGCIPVGAALVNGRGVLAGDCGARRHVVHAAFLEQEHRTVDTTEARVTCTSDSEGLRLVAPDGAALLQIDDRLDDAAVVLPPSLAPRETRAVWTGRAILIARRRGTELDLFRYRCDGAELIRIHAAHTSPPPRRGPGCGK